MSSDCISLNWQSKSWAWGLGCLGLLLLPGAVRAETIVEPVFEPIRPPIACPRDVETLTPLLLRDLPSYTNRVTQRLFAGERKYPLTAVIVASPPELEPLSLGPGIYSPDSEGATPPQQVFFTTLEWLYTERKIEEQQQYHWLFLTQNDQGWWLVLMFSQLGSYPAGRPPTPPRDSSEGIVAQAVRLWLKDCQAGAISPLKAEPIVDSQFK